MSKKTIPPFEEERRGLRYSTDGYSGTPLHVETPDEVTKRMASECECGKPAPESGACVDCEASCRAALALYSDDDPNACPHFAEGVDYVSELKACCTFCQKPGGKTGWLTVLDAYNRSRIHVVPLNDSIVHRTVRDECVCGPQREGDGARPIYVHASLDGRA